MKQLVVLFLFQLIWAPLDAQETFNKVFTNPAIQHVLISNFSGPINVQESENDQIEIVATLENNIRLPNVQIDFKADADYLMVYLRTPCTIAKDSLKFDQENPSHLSRWHSNCDWMRSENQKLPTIRFNLKVPEGKHIYLSTILHGDVRATGLTNKIWASNINGNISLESVVNISSAKTINGDIAVHYMEKPSTDAEFSTINGNIEIDAPADLNASMSFKSFQGGFYTDFSSVNQLADVVTTSNIDNGFRYKVENRKRIEINDGGPKMNFETFNGNVYLNAK